MKLLVFSDSHGAVETMCRLVEAEAPDAVLHLGDYVRDANALALRFPRMPALCVPGNCDGPTGLPDSMVQQYAGVTLFMTHGHRYGVKQSLLRLSYAAREADAQVALFGHTHCPLCVCEENLWLLNPGPCPDYGPAGYGRIELCEGKVFCELVSVARP